MRVGACRPTSWMENIKPASSLIVKPRCGEQGSVLLIWLVSAVMRWRLRTKQSDMRKININNPEELKRFKLETSGFVSSYGFPYRLDDLTEKGANYTVFCPIRWKSAFSPAKLHKLLKEDVVADRIHVEYIDFVKEEEEDKKDKIWKIDYD